MRPGGYVDALFEQIEGAKPIPRSLGWSTQAILPVIGWLCRESAGDVPHQGLPVISTTTCGEVKLTVDALPRETPRERENYLRLR